MTSVLICCLVSVPLGLLLFWMVRGWIRNYRKYGRAWVFESLSVLLLPW